jgi:hypothetical protein
VSTRARIAITLPDGTFRSVYLHSDGDPSWTGRLLLAHHDSDEAAAALVALGDLSTVGATLADTYAYGRDDGEADCEPIDDATLLDLAAAAGEGDAEWLYLRWAGAWYYGRPEHVTHGALVWGAPSGLRPLGGAVPASAPA